MAIATVQVRGLDYIPSEIHNDAAFYPHQANASKIDETLPGFPSHYTGERVWVGSEMALRQDEWMIVLSEQDNIHILEALRYFQGLKVAPELVSPTTFPLPKHLSNRLRNISHDCYDGRGFAVLRGLHPETFTDEENILVFAGVSSHVASKRGFQDVNREVVTCHVYSEDTREGAKEHGLKPAFTNGRLAFHTDLGEILTLYAKDVSNSAGETLIASSSQIYNELAVARPDLLQEFAKDWTFYQSQNYNTDRVPLVTNASGDKLVFQFSRLPITGFRNSGPNPTLPPPTPKRLEAMSMLEQLARRDSFALPRKPGDIAFINNMCLMHARNAFDLDVDGNPLPSKRHLIKLMLQDPELMWDLPESLNWYRERIYGANQADGGRTEKWQLDFGSEKGWAGEGSASNG